MIEPVYIGPIVTLGIFTATQVGSLIWVLASTKRDSNVFRKQLGEMQEELKKVGNVLLTLADFRGELNLVNERQNAQAKRLDEQQSRSTKQIDELYRMIWEQKEEKGK